MSSLMNATIPTPLPIDLNHEMFQWKEGSAFLDSYSREYMPSWNYILVYRACVFATVRQNHFTKPTYNEHMIVYIRGTEQVLFFINDVGKGGSRATSRPLFPDVPRLYVDTADQVIHFKTWPFGKVTFIKCRDECGRDIPPRQAKGKFHRQFAEWCDNL